MVKNIKEKFQCEQCEMIYSEKKFAVKCEEWCEKNKSCNIEIIKNVIK